MRLFVRIKLLLKQRPFLVSIVSAIAAVFLAWGYLDRLKAQILEIAEPVHIVVAAKDIAPGESIDPSVVRLESIPRRFLEPMAVTSLEDADGRVAMIALKSGTQLTSAVAKRISEAKWLSALVPMGNRAFAVSIDENQARFVKPYDTTDVLATFDLGPENSLRRTTMTIVEKVQVLAVGTEVADTLPAKPARKEAGVLGIGSNTMPASRGVVALVLSVTPEQAQTLAFAESSGKLAVAIHPFGDEERGVHLMPTTISTITGGSEDLLPLKKGFREYRGR